MTISIIGAGYVGTVAGIGFAEMGNKVIFVGRSKDKIKKINSLIPPIFEKNLKELMIKNKGKFYAIDDYEEAITSSDVTFICVGTPSKKDGGIDLSYIMKVSEEIGKVLLKKKDFHVIVVKSTVLPGTTENIVGKIIGKISHKEPFKDFGLASNPEFLREGVALYDFLNPDRIVIGVNDERSKEIMLSLYEKFDSPKFITDINTAEMIKYVSNAFLATKISFANEIGNVCKKMGIDPYEVFKGVGLDHRINPTFFGAGLGFGGSCLPKDVRALIKKAEELNEDVKILKSIMEVNENQPRRMIKILKKYLPDLNDKKICVLGLAFKPNTDDIRESRSIPIVGELIKENAIVIAYDPKAIDNFSKIYPEINYVDSAQYAIDQADAVLIVTEWEEFKNLNYTNKIVIDGRKIEKAKKEAKIYEGLCW